MYTGNPNPVIWPLHCNIYILLNRSLNPCWQTPSFISFDKRKFGCNRNYLWCGNRHGRKWKKKPLTFIISIKTLKYAVFQAFILNDLDLHNELGTCQLTFNSDETIRQKLCVFITM